MRPSFWQKFYWAFEDEPWPGSLWIGPIWWEQR